MAPPAKMDRRVAAFLKKNWGPDEELLAYVYGKQGNWLFAYKFRFLIVTNRRVILTKAGLWVAEPKETVVSVPRDQVKLKVAKKGIVLNILRINFPGTPQIRLGVATRFIPARVVEALLPDDEPLLNALEDTDKDVRSAAARALVALGSNPEPPSTPILETHVTPILETHVGLSGDAALYEPIAVALKTWYRATADGRTGQGVCDDCNGYLAAGKTYFRPGGYLCCEGCTDALFGYVNWDRAIKDIDGYFGPGVPEDIKTLARTLT